MVDDTEEVKRMEAELDRQVEVLNWFVDHLAERGGLARAKDVTRAGNEAGYTFVELCQARQCCAWVNQTETGAHWELFPGLGR